MADISDRWTRVQALFENALDRPADERTAWLRAACGDEPDLYAEVAGLLDADADAHGLFGGRAADVLSHAELDDALTPDAAGERVGPWVLEERIGTGGMGTVYRARRADADGPDGFDQLAAVKRVKPGMDSGAVLARFRAERRILARLEHPGIARLLDGGLDGGGRPYFAMEHVDGVPVTDYCERGQLGVGARLVLFADVCGAVAYAHRQLVVHRDLKPSNVLVAEGEGGAARVKLLDFGIAKVLSDDENDALTRTGHRVLTPATAAPEQVRGEPPTTATDVYALGGLLYHLLCGAPPVDAEGGAVAVERAVLDATPPRPSARVTPAAAAGRGTTGTALRKRLRGDLDTICLKALRKEPERRYGSAAELLADVRRHLAGQPVEARPATTRYRADLFVSRHRAGVLGGVVAVVALVALTGFYTTRLAGERDRAETALARQAAVSGFLGDLIQAASPRQSQDREVTVREMLDQARENVDALDDRPAVQADVLDVLGNTYYELNDYAAAAPLQRRALALRRRLSGTPDSVLIDAYNRLGITFRNGDRPDSAIAYFEAGLALARERFGPDDFWNITLLGNLTDPYVRTGQHARAEAASREIVAIDDRTLDPDDWTRSFALNNLATTLTLEGRFAEAEPLLREAVRLVRRADDARTLSYPVSNLAWMLTEAGRPGEALPFAREGLALRVEAMGTGDQAVGESFKFVADALAARGGPGDYAAADSMYRRALDVYGATVGEEHRAYAYAWFGLGQLAMKEGRPAEAARRFRRVVDLRRGGEDAPRELARALVALGDALDATGDGGGAADPYREARSLAEAHLPEHDMVRSHAAACVALAEGADLPYRRAVAALARRVGRGHPIPEDLCRRGARRGLACPTA